ncbi:LysR family transcriptional regulator [Pedobacter aquatilis]|uniref:LysR family transcriptional regulator n=1 Tax=Pedobacter aquatilis TaxID=351343 RepID=UPI002931326E|nr:LysR family transcriptional regulator [Pedobacter aquatilis]
MDLQQIKYFLALADELHFWKTSAKMNITQSALSRQIQSLENELGVTLFFRNKRNVKLTPAGKFLKEKWDNELNEITHIHKFARQIHLGEYGTIRIAHPDSISGSLVPQITSRISEEFPKLQIELVQVMYENQQDFLSNYKLDLVITRDTNHDEGISARKIYTDHLALVVAADHPIKSVEDLTSEALAKERFILPVKDEGSSYNQIIRNMFKSLKVVPNVYLHSEFGSTIIALVRKNQGIAILPDSYIFHDIPGVRYISLPYPTDLYLNWRSNDQNPIIANIINLLLKI